MKLGFLDYPIDLETTLACARKAESLGYSRYWLTEHHETNDPWASPEIVVAILATQTKRIRIGTAGTLLSSHNPLRVANDFALLALIFRDRIDLGLARGSPTRAANGQMLGDGGFSGTYHERVAAVCRLLGDPAVEVPDSEPLSIPAPWFPPRVWILGSSGQSVALAVERGLPYCHALFLPTSGEVDLKAAFSKNASSTSTYAVAISVVCGATEDDVRRIAADTETKALLKPNVVGTPSHCIARIRDIADRFGTDEIILMDLAFAPSDRIQALTLLANEALR
jgi:luciferase family oxidoreductase group 1